MNGTIEQLRAIEAHPVYQQVIRDSFGGVLYNVANRTKYNSNQIIEMWQGLTSAEREAAGGVMQGAMHFLQGEE